jgi:hypothetical protein
MYKEMNENLARVREADVTSKKEWVVVDKATWCTENRATGTSVGLEIINREQDRVGAVIMEQRALSRRR